MNTKNATDERYFRKGFGLKKEVAGQLEEAYHNTLLEHMKSNDHRLQVGGLEIYLAREFGFCYGVDRAVEYAYQTRTRFPSRRIFLTGEIIHNPHVNRKLRGMGIEFLDGPNSGKLSIEDLGQDDVVIIPAFGVSLEEMERLHRQKVILVDTTCGSVLSVWKRVERYAREGITSIIHGKYDHEETRATASRVGVHPGGHYLVVLDEREARLICGFIEGTTERSEFETCFEKAKSRDFDPDHHLERVGVANQTTMLSSESLAIADMIRTAIEKRYGAEEVEERFWNFDTICSATQERQDAVIEMVETNPPDLMLVIGGFNSSNTTHLAEIARERTTAYHIDGPECIEGEVLRHQPVGRRELAEEAGWLPEGRVRIGITAGASTPNNKIGEVIEKLLSCRGIPAAEILGESPAK